VGEEEPGRDLRTICWLCHKFRHRDRNEALIARFEAEFEATYDDWLESQSADERDRYLQRQYEAFVVSQRRGVVLEDGTFMPE
jgi:hypothetical protein